MKTVIVGAGGAARIVYEICSFDHNLEVVAFVDNIYHGNDERIMGTPVIGNHSVLPKLIKDGIKWAIVAVGDNRIRATYFGELKSMGLEMVSVVHPTAYIASSVKLGNGVTIAMGALISTGTKIGDNVIINTGATIDHENEIGDHVHIGPGCCIAGRVTIKEGTFMGIGSVVKENITIGKHSTIGAGSVVLENIPDSVVAVGIPARVIRTEEDSE